MVILSYHQVVTGYKHIDLNKDVSLSEDEDTSMDKLHLFGYYLCCT